MQKTTAVVVPLISVDRRAQRPLHRQIYDAYRTAILRNELRSGQQVPSSRLLADELGISRIPVLSAYAELLAEGYFETRAGAGTFVSRSLPEHLTVCEVTTARPSFEQTGERRVSRRSEAIPLLQNRPWVLGKGAFSIAHQAFEQYPLETWCRLVSRYARQLRPASLQYGPPAGRKDVREALCTYLRSARGVHCEPEQIIMVSGSQQALHIAAQALLDPGDSVWMEEPGYWLAHRVFALAGARLVPVPVDEDGMNVAAGIKLRRRARLAFVTPSHQFPLGVTMTLARRLQLLEWAQKTGAWIIEDDYDSEFRYQSRPLASLQGLDSSARVIYVGTFSKVLFPSMRTGYMVVPPDLVDRFLAVRNAVDVTPPDLHHAVLAQFIEGGHFGRHLRRMRALYGERCAVLRNSIQKIFGSDLQILGDQSGMHLTVTLPDGMSDTELATRAVDKQLWLWPLSTLYLGASRRQGLLLGYGGVSSREIPRGVRLMHEVFGEMRAK